MSGSRVTLVQAVFFGVSVNMCVCVCGWGSQLELTGQSLFDFIHHKDINKVKEQMVTSELDPGFCVDGEPFASMWGDERVGGE